MRTQIGRFIRAGPMNSCLPSQQQRGSSILPIIFPSLSSSSSSSTNTILYPNPYKSLNYSPGRIGFGFHPPKSIYNCNNDVFSQSRILGASEFARFNMWISRDLCYKISAQKRELGRDPSGENSSRDMEANESHRFSFLQRWIGYFFGSIITFWWGHKADILKIEGDLEKVVKTVEEVAETVENVATVTEEISKDLEEGFPKDGTINKIAVFVEHLSEEAIEDAHKTKTFIHKVTAKEKTAEAGVKTAVETLEKLAQPSAPKHDAVNAGHDKSLKSLL
eukprot:Gb_33455 [translate_table: standard]